LKSITKQEAAFLRKNYPDIYISMSGKKKKSNRKGYYVTEHPMLLEAMNMYFSSFKKHDKIERKTI